MRVLIVFLLVLLNVQANIEIQSMKQVREANRGLSYLKKQQKQHNTTVKLKKYYLSKHMPKPFFFSSHDEVYELYLMAFLQKARPLWLEDDSFVFHTSSNKKYLKRLQKHYKKRYKIDLVLYKNPQFWKKKFELREISSSDFANYIDKKSASYLSKKKKKKHLSNKKKKVKNTAKQKVENTTIRQAQIRRKSEVSLVKKSIAYLKRSKENKSVALGKYILYKNVKSPFFFSSKEPIYNLYLTSILKGGTPKWLEDTKFVLHTSSNRKYLKNLQKQYKIKYNLTLKVAKNSTYKRAKNRLMSVDIEDVIAYLESKIPQKFKNRKKKTKVSKIKQKKQKSVKKQKKEQKRKEAQKKRKKEKARKQKEIKIQKRQESDRADKEAQKRQREQKAQESKAKERAKQEALAKERAKLAAQKQKVEAEKKALEAQKREIAQEKAAIEAEKKRLQEQKAKKETQRKAKEEERKKAQAKKEAAQAEQKRQAQKAEATAKKKKEDDLTSELDSMLKETSEYKEKLKRAESIKYY